MQKHKTEPEGIWFSLRDERGGTSLPLAPRRLWPLTLVFGAFFVVMGSILVSQLASLRGHRLNSVFDLSGFLFQAFWTLGWSVGVFILGAITFLLLFYRESARLQDGRLVRVFGLGPLHIRTEYDLCKVRNVQIAGGKHEGGETARVTFDYGNGSEQLGDDMSRAQVERLAEALLAEAVRWSSQPPPERSRQPAGFDLTGWMRRRHGAEALARREPTSAQAGAAPAGTAASGEELVEAVPPTWTSPSALALIAANLVPILGVVLFGWSLAEIMVLFWIESAVIGFYNLLKMAVVGKWIALLAGPFFLGHFGGFMAAHFLFIYTLFVRPLAAATPEEPLLVVLSTVFWPLRYAIATLFLSHGASFVTNFLGRDEHQRLTLEKLMNQPYKRVIVMHLTIIFGGWVVMLLKSPLPALVLLVALKTAVDLREHRREHRGEESGRS